MGLRSRQATPTLASSVSTVLLLYGSCCSFTAFAQFPLDFPPTCSQIDCKSALETRFGNWAGGLPLRHRDLLLDLLFSSEKGLGFTLARYNIGGGANPPSVTARFASIPWRLTPGFRASPTSKYDWTRDKNQRTILLGALARGVTQVQAVAYSPPAWLTITGDTTGGYAYGDENLSRKNYGAFAEYLGAVVIAYRELFNITFKTLSPSNEPLEGWWVRGGKQEGCNLKPTSTAALLQVVGRKFVALHLDTLLTAVDSWAADSVQPIGEFSQRALSVYDQVSVHGYVAGRNLTLRQSLAPRQALARMAAALGKPLAMSEWGPQNSVTSEIQTALIMAADISMDINAMGAVSWSYWQAVEKTNPQWGLVHANYAMAYNGGAYNGPLVYTITKSYWAMMHFSRWLTPGMWPIKLPQTCQGGLVAAYDVVRKRVVVIATNQLNRPLPLKIRLTGFVSEFRRNVAQAFLTTPTQNYTSVAVPSWDLSRATRVVAAPLSVTTWIVYGVRLPPGARGPGVNSKQGTRTAAPPSPPFDQGWGPSAAPGPQPDFFGGASPSPSPVPTPPARRHRRRKIHAPFAWAPPDAMPDKPL